MMRPQITIGVDAEALRGGQPVKLAQIAADLT
jgi:hypothetical protein